MLYIIAVFSTRVLRCSTAMTQLLREETLSSQTWMLFTVIFFNLKQMCTQCALTADIMYVLYCKQVRSLYLTVEVGTDKRK